jgi:hypothetical protein
MQANSRFMADAPDAPCPGNWLRVWRAAKPGR